jgi:hypothetical protein
LEKDNSIPSNNYSEKSSTNKEDNIEATVKKNQKMSFVSKVYNGT